MHTCLNHDHEVEHSQQERIRRFQCPRLCTDRVATSAAVYISVCREPRMSRGRKAELIQMIAGVEQCAEVKTLVQNALVEDVVDLEALCRQLER